MLKKLFKGNRFARSTLIYTISTFCNSAIPFFLLPLLTAYLTPEEYGIVSMFNAAASVLLPFVGMSVSGAIIRRLVDLKGKTAGEYAFNCLLIVFLFGTAVSVAMTFFRDFVVDITSIPAEYLWYISILAISTALCDMTLGVMQIQEKVFQYAVFKNLSTLTNAITSIVLIVGFGLSLRGRIYGIVIPKAVFALVGMVLTHRNLGFTRKINFAFMKDEVLNFGLPLIPANIKSTVLSYTDRLFITNFVGVGAAGIYSVGNQLSMPLLLLTQAVHLAYVPWLYKKLSEGNDGSKLKIVRYTYLYFAAILLLAAGWPVISDIVIRIFIGPQYQSSAEYVIWLSLAYAFSGMRMMVGSYIYYAQKLTAYAVITIAVTVLNIGLNYIFINLTGAIGTAQATLVAHMSSFMLTWILAAKVCKMPWLSAKDLFFKKDK